MRCEDCGTIQYPDREYRGGLCPPCFEAALDEEEKIIRDKIEADLFAKEVDREYENLLGERSE